jgi:hypothetical protein
MGKISLAALLIIANLFTGYSQESNANPTPAQPLDLHSSDGIDLAPDIAQYVDVKQGTLDESKLFALPPVERIRILSDISHGVHSVKNIAAYSLAKRAGWGVEQALAELDPSMLLDGADLYKVEIVDGAYAKLLDLYPTDRKDELAKELIAIIQLVGDGNDDALREMIRKRLNQLPGTTPETIDATLSRYKQRVKLIPDTAAFIVELRHRLKSTRAPETTITQSKDQTDIVFAKFYLLSKIDEAKHGQIDMEFAQKLGLLAQKAIENGWDDSALDKLKPLLEMYEAGKVEAPYIAGTLQRIGLTLMHKKEWEQAEENLRKSVDSWESLGMDRQDDKNLQKEYLQSLIYLGQVESFRGEKGAAAVTLDKALGVAQKRFGKDSQAASAVISARDTLDHTK